ncbi:helix-turn-helix transcriptional regulator [Allofournierella sp.]|uniref:helix-turn-helix transcriptional regulator n=1 Tax=Allofournierella sp. TaxID=1940256 RepID=UPI003AB32E9B
MEVAIFLYNILLILLFALNAQAFGLLWSKGRRKLDFWLMVMFLVFIVDDMLYYLAEFVDKLSASYSSVFAPSTFLAVGVNMAIIFSYYMISHNLRGLEVGYTPCIWWFVFSMCMAAAAGAGQENPVLAVAQNTLLIAIGVGQMLLAGARLGPAVPENERKGWRRLCWGCGVMMGLSAAEYALWYVFPQLSLSSLLNVISQRRLFLELMSIVMAFAGLAYTGRRQALLAAAPAEGAKAAPGQRFAAAYDLTGREREVLELVIEGRSNQQISETLCISLGTVKVHLHNIFQKADVTKRSQLLEEVQRVESGE